MSRPEMDLEDGTTRTRWNATEVTVGKIHHALTMGNFARASKLLQEAEYILDHLGTNEVRFFDRPIADYLPPKIANQLEALQVITNKDLIAAISDGLLNSSLDRATRERLKDRALKEACKEIQRLEIKSDEENRTQEEDPTESQDFIEA